MNDFTKKQAARWVDQEFRKAKSREDAERRIASELEKERVAPDLCQQFPVCHLASRLLVKLLRESFKIEGTK